MRDLKGRPHQAAFSVCEVPSADCEAAPSTSISDRKRKFELMFRAYGPTKDFFDKKWVLPDVVLMGK